MKQFKITTANNQQLESFLYGEENSNTAIIMCHGFSGSSSGIMSPKIAEQLSKDYLVCRFDFRGQGDSDGNFHKSSISLELEDLDYVVKHIKSNYSPKNIILLGHSFGCAIAFLYAQNNQIQGLVSLSGEGDLEKAIEYEFSEQQMKEFEENGETRYENWTYDGRMDLLGKQFLDDMRRYSTLDAAKAANYPVLYIHGTNDDVIPHIATEEMFEVTPSEKEKILMEGVDHMFDVFTDNPKVDKMINHVQLWLNKRF